MSRTIVPFPTDLWHQTSITKLVLGSMGLSGLGLLLFLKSKTSNLSRDLWMFKTLLLMQINMRRKLDTEWTTADFFAEALRRNPDGEALVYIDPTPGRERQGRPMSFTYRELDMESNKVANWALTQGFKPGDVAALMMENRPEFLICWLGLIKIGISPFRVLFPRFSAAVNRCYISLDQRPSEG